MTATAGAITPTRERSGISRLWKRELDHYPDTGPRMVILAIVVLATILLYYQLYVAGSVAPSIIQQYGMSFKYYVYISVIANALGAFASLIAGASDRYGRANLVTAGLLVTGLLTAFAVPHAPNKAVFAGLVILVGFVEGIILVATPALVRDFSPQLGRASAMGFWTLGPVIGSLVVSEVSSNTLSHLHAWQDQYTICGLTGIVVFLIALFGLRELSPNIRDQLMVSSRDRALIEARAKGLDIEAALKHPWRQMLHLDVVGSAFALSVFLLFYYAAVGFFVIYFTTIFGFTEKQANGLGNWFWALDALVLVIVGLVSDRLRVRKPFMILGGVGAIVMTIIFLSRATHPHTSYYSFVLIISLLAGFLAVASAPWMASFTETVERRNPALTATGLAVWGWIIRVIVAVSTFVLPFVVSSMTPLVTYGAQVSALATQYAPQLKTVSAIDPATLAALTANPKNTTAAVKAIGEIATKFNEPQSQALQELIAVGKVPKPAFAYLQAHGAAVEQAAKTTPHQWMHWWWVTVAGEVVFLPFVLLMAGRWRPKAAKRDAEEHQQEVDREMVSLGVSASV